MLLERKLIYTKTPPPVPTKLTAWYKPNLFCAFHQGAPGHDIEHCFVFQKVVQKLVRKTSYLSKSLNLNVQVNLLSYLGTYCCHMECLAAIGSLLMFPSTTHLFN